MATEQLFNIQRTTITGGYTAASGLLNVASTSGFAGSPQFHVAILDTTETVLKAILRVTAINSSTQFAVVAEVDASALAGDHVVGEFWSAEAVAQIKLDVTAATNLTGVYASLPSAGHAGRTYKPTDAPWDILIDNGSSWDHYYHGVKVTLPVDANYSWVNQDTATVTSQFGGISLVATGKANGGPFWHVRIVSGGYPTTPFTLEIGMIVNFPGKSFISAGIVFRDSAGGKCATLALANNDISVQKLTTVTSFSAAYIDVNPPISGGGFIWLRMKDDGTNRISYISSDYINWIQLHTVGRTDFVTPNTIGFGVTDENNATPNLAASIFLLHWRVF